MELTLPAELYDRVEGARGLVPRAAWIKAALESALGNGPGLVERSTPVENVTVGPPENRTVAPWENGSQRRFKCGCPFTGTSEKAMCPKHGRGVVPV